MGGWRRMDDSVQQLIRSRAERAIAEKVFPGCVIGLIRAPRPSVASGEGGNKHIVIPVGTIDGKVPTQKNTIYDLASITKSIPLASLALLLTTLDPPRLNLGGKVVEYLQELQNDYDATIEDLLRYRVTGPRLSQLHLKTFEEIRTYVFEHGFDAPAGDGAYTNLPAFLLGIILERVGGATLPALAHRYFFEPLQMNDTTFFPRNPDTYNSTYRHNNVYANIAPTEIVEGKEIRGIVHDESARVFARARRAVGHAGLFSTAPDLLNFLGTLLLPAEQSHILKNVGMIVDGAQEGLGWEIDREWMGAFAKASATRGATVFGKTGFTGTSILCETEKGIGLVILSNRTHPHRPPDNSAINAFRKDVADIVFG